MSVQKKMGNVIIDDSNLTAERTFNFPDSSSNIATDQSNGFLPLGAVIAIASVAAWELPGSGSIKNGFALCNGQTFPAGSNAAFTGSMPNLSDSRFLQGSTAVGGTGGASTINLQHNHTVGTNVSVSTQPTFSMPAHYHGFGTGSGITVSINHTHAASAVSGTVGGSDGTHTHTLTNATVAASSHVHTIPKHYHGFGTGTGMATSLSLTGSAPSLGGTTTFADSTHLHGYSGNGTMNYVPGNGLAYTQGGTVVQEPPSFLTTNPRNGSGYPGGTSTVTISGGSYSLSGSNTVTGSVGLGAVGGGVDGNIDQSTTGTPASTTVSVNTTSSGHGHAFSLTAAGQTLTANSGSVTGNIGLFTGGVDGNIAQTATRTADVALTNGATTVGNALSTTQDIRPQYFNVVYVMRVA